MDKIQELQEIVESLLEKEDEDDSLKKLNDKQIFWLCLDEDVKNFTEKSTSYKDMILFSAPKQLISFFKYLYAVKPNLQFDKLKSKFLVVIDLNLENKGRISEDKLKELLNLFEWFSFTGSRIPTVVYSKIRLEKSSRMKIEKCYYIVNFSNDMNDLEKYMSCKETKEETDHKKNSSIKEVEHSSSHRSSVHKLEAKTPTIKAMKHSSSLTKPDKNIFKRGNTYSSFRMNSIKEKKYEETSKRIQEASHSSGADDE